MNDLNCVVCHGSYNLERNIPKVLRCGHTHCNVCITKMDLHRGGIRCPLCNMWGKSFKKNEIEFPTNFALVQMLEQKKNENGDFSFKCAQCEIYGKASEQHICITCVQSDYKLVNIAEQIDDIPEGIDSLVLCASCAIKNHCQKKHETTELSALKLDYAYHQKVQEVRNIHMSLQEENKKLAKRADETRLLLNSCTAECDHAITVMRESKLHRNQALAWPSLKKSLEVLRNTYSYCDIKLAEVNARLIEGLPRETLKLLEHRPREYATTPLRLEPITDTMKFRIPAMFPVDQNVQATESVENTPARTPTPEEDDDEYESDQEHHDFPELADLRREQRRLGMALDSDDSDDGGMIYRRLTQGANDDAWSGGWEAIFSGPLAEMNDANPPVGFSGANGQNANPQGFVAYNGPVRMRGRRPRPY